MSTYDEAYHPPRCSCGQPAGPMSVQEYLWNCFYPRLIEKPRTNSHKETTLGGIRSSIPLPKRSKFLPNEYKDSRIWNGEQRHPLLCLNGHYNWDENSDKTPSSMYVSFGVSLSTLKIKIEKGDYIFGPHFKHHYAEHPLCHCGAGLADPESLLEEQRDAALANRVNGVPCLQDNNSVYELIFFVLKQIEGFPEGSSKIDMAKDKHLLPPTNLETSVSLWLQSRDAGSLPANCAGFLIASDSTKENQRVFIPDTGKITLIIPNAEFEIMKEKLQRLKKDLREGVKLMRGKATSLTSIPDYYQGTIEWKDEDSHKRVKEFISDLTGLETQNIRSTRPLILEVYDKEYEAVTPVDDNTRNSDYAFDEQNQFFIKIRRARNTPLEGFRILLGPGFSAGALQMRGLEASNLGFHENSGGTLWKIFIRDVGLQNGIWAKVKIDSIADNTWLEVFDHGSSVEQSGMRIQVVSKESV